MTRWLGILLVCGLCACSDDPEPALQDNPLCAFDCPMRGVAEGNSAISGVSTADTYFQAAVAYTNAADHVSAAIEGELAQLRLEFGLGKDDALGAKIRSQGDELLGQSPAVVAAQALCWVDTLLLANAQSACDPMAQASDALQCDGFCRVEPGTDCTPADVFCSQNSAGTECAAKCTGTCASEPDPGGGCDGMCMGTCDGRCDAFAVDADGGAPTCAGRCSGRCTGQCVRPVVDANCHGPCRGICTDTKLPECTTAVEMRCRGKSGRQVACPGQCAGKITIASGNAECDAAAQAQASYFARCDAPSVAVTRPPGNDAPSSRELRYLRALRAFEQRLPELLAETAHAKAIRSAGQDLAAAATSGVKDSFKKQSEAEGRPVAETAGMQCALAEAARISQALDPAQRRLSAAIADADEMLGAFGLD